MSKLNVLLLGGGGREHTMAWRISQSHLLKKLFIAPGNPGTAEHGMNLNFTELDFKSIKSALIEYKIQLLVVGPEAPLVEGIRDFIENDTDISHVKIIGPDKIGAQLEGSKSFSKAFMMRNNIPTASYGKFSPEDVNEAKLFLKTMAPPFVLKADGLAAGKGVVIVDDEDTAIHEIMEMLLGGKFGKAGHTLVIEEFLKGIELSVFVLSDGENYVILPSAKDYKRIGEGDTGLNTGGMGSLSPVPFADEAFMQKVEQRIIIPTVNGLRAEGISYVGFIFIGLMKVAEEPFVIEYNCRMGDPETESVLPRIKSDFLDLLWNCANGEINKSQLDIDARSAATVVLVSKGYPEEYEKGKRIKINETGHSHIFHSGTKKLEKELVTNGGRVIAVTSLGNNFLEALSKTYLQIADIEYEGKNFRSDIGSDL